MAKKKRDNWTAVPGFDLYEASRRGRVRNAQTKKVLAGTKTKKGYVELTLYKDGRAKKVYLHRAILLTFVGPPPAGHVTDHISGDKGDCALKNLEWVTCQENSRRAVRLGLLRPWFKPGEANVMARLKEADVLWLRQQRRRGRPVAEAARQLGLKYSTAYYAATGRSWKSVGGNKLVAA